MTDLYDWPAVQRLAARVVFHHNLRRGSAPLWLMDLATAASPAVLALKYRPDQSRVPAGDPAGGRFADEGRGGGHGATGHWSYRDASANNPPRVEDIDDRPLGHAYGVDAVIGGAAYGVIASTEAVVAVLPIGTLRNAWQAYATAFDEIYPYWRLGDHKSPLQWANRLAKGNWTPEKVTDVIAKGRSYASKNWINEGNTSTVYIDDTTGNYVVRDDVTKEILHVSEPGYTPPKRID